MKTSKRILSIVIALALLISTVALVASVSASAADKAYCQYKNYWYGKTEGWHSGASNIGEIKDYITVADGKMNVSIPSDVGMNSQQISANFSMDGTEKVSGTLALEEAVNGSGKLYFVATLNSIKNGKGADLSSVNLKYSICGKSKEGISVAKGTSKTIEIDVSDITDTTTMAAKGVYFYFQDPNWGGGISEIDLSVSYIYVKSADSTTTTAAATTTKAAGTTAAGTTAAGTTSGSTDTPTAGKTYCQYKNYWYGKSEGWYAGASNLGDVKDYITVGDGKLNLNIPASEGMSSQQINVNYSMDYTEKVSGTLALEEALAGSGKMFIVLQPKTLKNKKGVDSKQIRMQVNLFGGKVKSGDIYMNVGDTKVLELDVSEITDAATYAQKGVGILFQGADWEMGISEIDCDISYIYVLAEDAPTTTEAETTTEETTTEAETTTEEVTTEAETTTEEVTTTEEATTEAAAVVENDPDFPAYQEGTFAFVIGNVQAKPGETVEVPITVENNPGMWGLGFSVKYDPKVLTAVETSSGVAEATNGEVFDASSLMTGPVQDTADGMKAVPLTFNGTNLEDYTKSGVLVTLKFTVNEDAEAGTNLAFTDFSPVCNLDGEDVDATFKAGAVELAVATTEPTTAEPTTEPAPTEPTSAPMADIENDSDFPAYQEGTFAFVIGNVTGKKGDVVEVPITVENNPGIWGLGFSVKYDPAVLTAVETSSGVADATNGEVFDASSLMTGPVQDTADGMKAVPITYNGTNLENYTNNGVLVTLKFVINSDDIAGSVLAFTDFSPVCNLDGDDVDATFKAGSVALMAPTTVPTTEAATDAPTTVAPATTAAIESPADVETTVAADETPVDVKTTAADNSDDDNDDVNTGAAAPLAALAVAAGAAFVAFKARKK